MRTLHQALPHSRRRKPADFDWVSVNGNGRKTVSFDACPHPGPLPRGEGEQVCVVGELVRRFGNRRVSGEFLLARPRTRRIHIAQGLQTILPFHEPGVWCPPFRVSVGPEHAKAWTPNRALRFLVQCMRESERGPSMNRLLGARFLAWRGRRTLSFEAVSNGRAQPSTAMARRMRRGVRQSCVGSS